MTCLAKARKSRHHPLFNNTFRQNAVRIVIKRTLNLQFLYKKNYIQINIFIDVITNFVPHYNNHILLVIIHSLFTHSPIKHLDSIIKVTRIPNQPTKKPVARLANSLLPFEFGFKSTSR
jgi:hypothetical protein